MNLFTHIKELLSKNEKFCKDNELFKNNVVEAALKLDTDLIKLLLTDNKAKETFFSDIEGVMVFDKVKFQKFVSNKQFLPDSYTAFKNKIGLTANGEFLTDAKEVVLDFPYKDCVLEGGQTKEDQKRKEIFWNETLAPDDIDRLFEPKAFTNWKKYDKDGEHEVTDISLEDNLIIKGNNLIALHSLKEVYRGKVKLIYIDPPYNTGNDGFNYNDSFNHSTWLTFIKNRLEAAKQLLTDDGVIFVQCDDNQQAYLKVLMDEIFIGGYLQTVSVKKATSAGFKSINSCPITTKEYIYIYSKRKGTTLNKVYVKAKYVNDYNTYISNIKEHPSKWIFISLNDLFFKDIKVNTWKKAKEKLGENWKSKREEWIEIFANNNSESIISFKDLHKPSQSIKNFMNESKINKEKVIIHQRDGQDDLFFKKGRSITFYKNKFKNIKGDIIPAEILSDIWTDIKWDGIAKEGGVELKNGKKPERLLERILELGTNKGDIVLDFHLGSGTTAAVAHKMGRRYIGIEQLDYGQNDSIIRLQNVINNDKSGVSKVLDWQGGGSFILTYIATSKSEYISSINNSKDSNQLLEIWEKLKKDECISHKVSPTKFDKEVKDFKNLDLEQQKQFLLSIIDSNQLYVNYSDMEDKNHTITDTDKDITTKFYNL